MPKSTLPQVDSKPGLDPRGFFGKGFHQSVHSAFSLSKPSAVPQGVGEGPKKTETQEALFYRFTQQKRAITECNPLTNSVEKCRTAQAKKACPIEFRIGSNSLCGQSPSAVLAARILRAAFQQACSRNALFRLWHSQRWRLRF